MANWNESVMNRAREAKILLLGCSAGGFNLVYNLITRLPDNFPLPILVVVHRSRKFKSAIEELLDRKSNLKVSMAADKDKILPGHVYFAPSDYHLLLEPDGSLTLDYSEPVLYSRPSIDTTFQSVADVYRDRIVAVLLSGASEDGSEGICYIHSMKGVVIIQDPGCAEIKTMPESAISKCKDALILDDNNIFDFINSIADTKFSQDNGKA